MLFVFLNFKGARARFSFGLSTLLIERDRTVVKGDQGRETRGIRPGNSADWRRPTAMVFALAMDPNVSCRNQTLDCRHGRLTLYPLAYGGSVHSTKSVWELLQLSRYTGKSGR